MYYLQSRYYNPEWGRFINSDGTIGEEGQLLSHNMFAYCKNNPIVLSDEDGFRPIYSVDPNEETDEEREASFTAMKGVSSQLTNAHMNDLGKGWSYRREKSKTSNTGETDHLQVRGPGGIEVGQNANGKPHPTVVPSPPGWVKKELKEREGWDWDAKNKQYQDGQSVKKAVAGGTIIVGGGYVVYRIVRFIPSLLPPFWSTIPANALCP